MMPPSPARIDGILAREANVALIFRRGPSKLTQCLRWNLDTDEVVPGQWVTGQVYVRRSDLSPDGELLVVAITNYSRKQARRRAERGEPDLNGWTAVSRPPYFTALALWESCGTYYQGGLWRDSRSLELDLSRDQSLDPESVPSAFRVSRLDSPYGGDECVFIDRLLLGGWRMVPSTDNGATGPGEHADGPRAGLGMSDTSGPVAGGAKEHPRETILEKPFPGGRLVLTVLYRGGVWAAYDDEGRVHLESSPLSESLRWIEVDHHGRLIYGDKGCLWAWADFPSGRPTLIADLNPNRFADIPAPEWAREWPA